MSEPTTAPTPAAAPAAAPAPASTPPSATAGPSVADEIRSIASESKKAVPAKTPAKTQELKTVSSAENQQDPATGSPSLTTEKGKSSDTSATPAASKEAGDKPVDVAKLAPAQLRSAYEKLKAEHNSLRAEHEKIKTAKPAEDPEKKTLVEALEARNKRLQELEQQLSFKAYEESQDYKDKYQKPFEQAFVAGRAKIAGLKVIERKDLDTGDVLQASRQATSDDFDSIMRISDDDTAAGEAERLFGSKAAMVLFHRERVQELASQARNAISEHRATAAERTKADMEKQALEKARMTEHQKTVSETFHAARNAIAEADPEILKPVEGDDEGNRALEIGSAVTALAFGTATPEQIEMLPEKLKSKVVNGRLPPIEVAKLHGEVFQRAAGYGRLKKKFEAVTKKTQELEKRVAELVGGGPGSGETGGEAQKREKTFEEEIMELAR
jgi:hypothetical protein